MRPLPQEQFNNVLAELRQGLRQLGELGELELRDDELGDDDEPRDELGDELQEPDDIPTFVTR